MSVGSLGAQVRRGRIRDLLASGGSLDLSWAADELGVSEMTIRRDLLELERQGLARRVRGGAVAVAPELFERRAAQHHTAKLRIAMKLRTLLPAQGVVAMDSSSTVHRFALEIAAPEITVLTPGIETFQALRGRVGRALLTGGEWEEATGSFIGPLAVRAVDALHADVTFLSASGLDPERGALESTLENAEVKRALRRSSATVVLAADASKLGQPAAALALTLAEIDVLVTDLDPADPVLDPYRAHLDLL
ncbi:DeoR/GlpR family DNA-binding transcription regulator [Propioniciclava soli]|uniref:DeoR/GlpR family DNA-binding transcription regulator n=1 Tax=Propioniciclava soli TaxID=2775081 RepID=A0ABZ3CAN3_9ACTN